MEKISFPVNIFVDNIFVEHYNIFARKKEFKLILWIYRIFCISILWGVGGQICQDVGGQISPKPSDKCRSIVKKAGEAISHPHFHQFILHFYSDQNSKNFWSFAFCNHLIFLNDLSHNFKCFIPDYDYPNLTKIICMKFQKEIVVDFFNVLRLLFKNVIF